LRVEARNLQQTNDLLKAIDPVLLRTMDKHIRTSMNVVRDRARVLAPSVTGGLRAGIGTRKGRKAGKVAWQVRSQSRQGAILEFAAESKTTQGASLVTTLTARYGAPGRFVWEAWDQKKDTVLTGVEQAVAEGEAVVNTELAKLR
jgi:hypothetical protein